MGRINVTKTFLPPLDEYQDYVRRIWETDQLTNQGPLVLELEQRLKGYLDVSYCHFVANGTLALQLAIRALGITSGEIITTPFTYVATTSAILWEGCKPVYVDIEPETFCINPDKIEAAITSKTKAILAVHVFGIPCNIEKIEKIAKKHNLKVIYDAAQAFGVEYKGTSIFNYGDVSICSFHATKVFHTIEGGAIITKDKALSEKKHSKFIGAVPNLSVNIMTQNILLIQPPEHTAHWFSLTPHVTQTMAHDKYTTQEISDEYDTPVHLFSTYIEDSQFDSVPFEKKEKLILLSPDLIPERKAVAASLKKKFPGYTIQTIQNLTYEQYKELMGRARFAITFGEGFDGYYAGGYFSNTIVFAVYNEEFFPSKEFKNFKNTYSSNADMLKNIASDIEKFNNKKSFDAIVKANLAVINVFCSYANYVKNVEKFYKGEYTYTPSQYSAEKLIGKIVRESEKTLAERDALLLERHTAIKEMEVMIADKTADIHGLVARIEAMEKTTSWKVTKPLRKANRMIKR